MNMKLWCGFTNEWEEFELPKLLLAHKWVEYTPNGYVCEKAKSYWTAIRPASKPEGRLYGKVLDQMGYIVNVHQLEKDLLIVSMNNVVPKSPKDALTLTDADEFDLSGYVYADLSLDSGHASVSCIMDFRAPDDMTVCRVSASHCGVLESSVSKSDMCDWGATTDCRHVLRVDKPPAEGWNLWLAACLDLFTSMSAGATRELVWDIFPDGVSDIGAACPLISEWIRRVNTKAAPRDEDNC